MLILVRRVEEGLWVGDDVLITILKSQQGRVKLGISAPEHVKVVRAELRTGAQALTASDTQTSSYF